MNSHKKKIRFIVNPISGTGKQHSIESLIEKHIDKSLYKYEIALTQAPKHATELSREAVRQNYDIVAAVGGDGSVNEVGSALIGSNIAMAIIPTGSGNGLARHLTIPLQLEKAIQLINNYNIKNIDTGVLNKHIFIATTGIGFDAMVALSFSKSTTRGIKTYVKMVWKTYKKYIPQDYKITADGHTVKQKTFLICCANSRQYGNRATIAPQAIIDDGLLDVCILKKFPFYVSPFIVLRLFNQTIHQSKYMEIIRGREIVINLDKTSGNEHGIAHIDGEPTHIRFPLHISINPKSLKVIVP